MGAIDGNTKTTLTQVIQKALEKANREISVALPAKVVTYKISGNKLCADIQITVQKFDGEEYIDFPQINNVPVHLPSGLGGLAFVSVPLAANDHGMLIACDYGIDGWKNTDGSKVVEPSSLIQHSFGNAFFIPGINTNLTELPGISTDDLVIKNGSTAIDIEAKGDITIDSESNVRIKASTIGDKIYIGNNPIDNPVTAIRLNTLMLAVLGLIDGQLSALGQPGGSAALWTAGYASIFPAKVKICDYTEI